MLLDVYKRQASERETTLFQKMYCDSWFTTNTPQMSLTAEALVGKYNLRIMATLTVSYTHIDVYKRQSLLRLCQNCLTQM